jgi:hypothetical protein
MQKSPFTLGFQRMSLLTDKQKAAIHFKFIHLPQDEIYREMEQYLAELSEEDYTNIEPLNFSNDSFYHIDSESAYKQVREIRTPNEDSYKEDVESFQDHMAFNGGEVDIHNDIDVIMFGNARISQTVYAPESTTTSYKTSSMTISFQELEKVYLDAKVRRKRDIPLLAYMN